MYEKIAVLSYSDDGRMLAAMFLSIFGSILIYLAIIDALNAKRYSRLKKAKSLIEAGHEKAMATKAEKTEKMDEQGGSTEDGNDVNK